MMKDFWGSVWKGLLIGASIAIGAALVGRLAAAIINPLPYNFQNGTVADATQVNANFAQIVANVNANAMPITATSLVPTATLMAFNLGTCPTGWVRADGTNGTIDLRTAAFINTNSQQIIAAFYCQKT